MTRMPFILLAVVAGTVPALAQESAVDCTAPAGATDRAVCASPALAELDAEVDRVYRLALAGTADPAPAAELTEAQTAWRTEDACVDAADVAACLTARYATRIHALLEAYPAAGGADEMSVTRGPYTYRCEGLDTPISAVFIGNEAPLVSLEVGGDTIVLPQAVSASGARYTDAAETTTFWSKGASARFERPGEDALICEEDD
ncbi:MliC family protein [Acuticoccus mangrovi]|uniref:MliC family protein n=1 Tax=Acuticoccus mangrovi TaxID=2796142 RepID=A0A934IIW1_9HYPH|nr:MliC family protein [Acuticoccus mangrovi]MBJ3777514.1 MliC family protein [Acuticoccus mangrovi]